MRGRGLLALGLLAGLAQAACTNDTPTLPGQFLGTFLFNGTLQDGSGGTTCLLDGGSFSFPSTVQFYAQVSLLDAGAMVWQLQNALPVQGLVEGQGFSVTTKTPALISGCGCTAALAETVALVSDAGLVPGLSSLIGSLDDRLDPDPTQTPVCSNSQGQGCQLGCDLIYAVAGTPGRP